MDSMRKVLKESYPKYIYMQTNRISIEIEKMIVEIITKNPREDYGTFLNLVFKNTGRMDMFQRN